jgi:type II secretory pathway pseudopilin PulG
MKNYGKGITLIEIIVVIFIITLFSLILISNFPAILRQFALSRAAYKLSQDIRKAEDLSLSGVQIASVSAKGYGVYITLATSKQYIIYADSCPSGAQNYYYTPATTSPPCTDVVETIDISKDEPGVYIKSIIHTVDSNSVSINFAPPNPNIIITTLQSGQKGVDIVLGLDADPSAAKTVSVNKFGLIEVK